MRRIYLIAACGAAAAVGAILLWGAVPGQSWWLPKCVFFQATGLHCPGCGATRAVHALIHGDLWLAVRMNPLLVLGGPVIAGMIAYSRRHQRRTGLAVPKITWTICAVVIAYFVLRNVPTPSTSPLAPLPPRAAPTAQANTHPG